MVSGLLPQNGACSDTTTLPSGSLLTGRDADPDVAALLAVLLLPGLPARIVQQAQRLIEHRAVVSAVVQVSGGDLVRELLGPDQVAAPKLDAVKPELVGSGVDHALDHEVRHLGAKAAIGALLAFVGQDRGDVELDAADAVRADNLRQG